MTEIEELNVLATNLKDLKELKKRHEEQAEIYSKKISSISKDLYVRMITNGLTSIRVKDVGLVTATETELPSITDDEVFFNFLKAVGHEAIKKTSVNAHTLRSWWVKEGKSFGKNPEELGLSIFTKENILFTKDKNKKEL